MVVVVAKRNGGQTIRGWSQSGSVLADLASMKGTIARCLKDTVIRHSSEEAWKKVLTDCGHKPMKIITPGADMDDGEVMKLFEASCAVLDMDMIGLGDAFGEEWIIHYTPKIYNALIGEHRSVKGFLLAMNDVHDRVTQSIPNAHPPRFRFEPHGDDELVVHYEGDRGLAILVPGLVRALGKKFEEEIGVSMRGEATIQITWSEAGRSAA